MMIIILLVSYKQRETFSLSAFKLQQNPINHSSLNFLSRNFDKSQRHKHTHTHLESLFGSAAGGWQESSNKATARCQVN